MNRIAYKYRLKNLRFAHPSQPCWAPPIHTAMGGHGFLIRYLCAIMRFKTDYA